MTGKLNKLSKQFTRLCAMALQGPKRQLPKHFLLPRLQGRGQAQVPVVGVVEAIFLPWLPVEQGNKR